MKLAASARARVTTRQGVEMTAPLIGIVDDDDSIRESTSSLIRSAGYSSALFESGESLLNSEHLRETACLIVDIRMPGLSGLELQRELCKGIRSTSRSIPIIFITAHAEERERAIALKQGALAFLAKPFSDEALLSAIQSALELQRGMPPPE
jgi:FixJ family two-component response regulator